MPRPTVRSREARRNVSKLWRDGAPLPEMALAIYPDEDLPPLDNLEAWRLVRQRVTTQIRRLRERHGRRLFPYRRRPYALDALDAAADAMRKGASLPALMEAGDAALATGVGVEELETMADQGLLSPVLVRSGVRYQRAELIGLMEDGRCTEAP